MEWNANLLLSWCARVNILTKISGLEIPLGALKVVPFVVTDASGVRRDCDRFVLMVLHMLCNARTYAEPFGLGVLVLAGPTASGA